MKDIIDACNRITSTENELARHGLYIERWITVGRVDVGWARHRASSRWRLMSEDPDGRAPQPRPLIEQPALVKVIAARGLLDLENAVDRAWTEATNGTEDR